MTPELRQKLLLIPKAELHLHLEGSVKPETLWILAQKHPDHSRLHGIASLDDCKRLYSFSSFHGFIHAIKTASLLMLGPEEYAEVVTCLADDLKEQGVAYTEVFFSVGILIWRQLDPVPYFHAIEEARLEAERTTGVRIGWIFDSVRQFGSEALDRVLDLALTLQTSDSVLGIGIGGDEAAGPATWFTRQFERARANGLRTTAHAGETCGPQSVWDTLNLLKPDRIGHGLHAIEDPRLIEALAASQIVLDICPTSNLKTGAWPPHLVHPAHSYYERGIKIAISTDDPGIFGCTLLDEYAYLADHCGFHETELIDLALHSRPRRIRVAMDGCE
ncbi:MAG TPA: adenosine deaminase [Terriglobales bacterium]|nr:adenosine deaminase [Terriglobales bacterium]